MRVEELGARGSDDGPEGDARHVSGRDRDAVAEREDRVEHGADRIRQRLPFHCRGVADVAAAAEEAGAVGLVLRLGGELAFHDGEMSGPDLRLLGRAAAARGDERAELGKILGLDEHLREGGMGVVGGRRRQHDLGIGGELDLARAGGRCWRARRAGPRRRLRRDENIHERAERAVVADELGAILAEADLVAVRLAAGRLRARGPDLSGLRVPQEDVGAPSRRVSRPRASVSPRYRASGCSPTRPRSASRRSGRWTEDA